MSSMIAVRDSAAADSAGATIWWRLSTDKVRRDELVDRLSRRLEWGCPHPPLREPEVALRRAVQALRGKRRLVRPIRRGVWAVVSEEVIPSRDELRHWGGATITLNKIGEPTLTNASEAEVTEVQTAYRHHLDHLSSEDLSAWLIDVVDQLNGVALRRGGGIYYLPPAALLRWRPLAALLEEAGGGVIYSMPTVSMASDGARAILDALLEGLADEVARVRQEVVSGDLGVRALGTRADRAANLVAKVREYERLLERPMANALSMIDELQVDIAAAKLAAEAVLDAPAAS